MKLLSCKICNTNYHALQECVIILCTGQIFHFFSGKASIWNYVLWGCLSFAVCCTLQTPNRCLLDLVGVDPTPAGCVDGWPTIGLFLSRSLSLFFFNLAMRAADLGGERRGETKERIVIWEPKTDWVSKSLAPVCCRRQPAKKRFLCTFTTVNGKFNQSYIEMVISSADTHVRPCIYYITQNTQPRTIHAGARCHWGAFWYPEMYAHTRAGSHV